MSLQVAQGEKGIATLLPPSYGKKLRVVIDSDAYNEVDDQFAIAYALRSPERLNVEAIYAAPYVNMPVFGMTPEAVAPDIGMELSHQEILRVLDVLEGSYKGKVYRGATAYLPDQDHFVESEAARDLVKRAMESEEPLYVLGMAAPTNIASAILMEPEIIKKIVVVWLGGQPYYFPSAAEFNISQDYYASKILFDSGVPLVHIPCNHVASYLNTTAAELRAHFLDSKIGSYLTELLEKTYRSITDIPAYLEKLLPFQPKGLDDYPEDISASFRTENLSWSRILWDIAVPAYLINPCWCPTTLIPAPRLTPEFTWEPDSTRHAIRTCNYIYRDAVFGDLFSKLSW